MTTLELGDRARIIDRYIGPLPRGREPRSNGLFFGLMGYELVEGLMRGGGLVEARRTDLFTDRPASPSP